METKEIWKPVKGYEEWAEISNYGQIHRFEKEYYCGKNHKTKRIQEETWTYGSENDKGYLYVGIGNKKIRVNRLVYMTFYDCDIPEGLQVNHIDENKHNNRLDNLNLMTPKENTRWGTGNARRSDALKGRKLSTETRKKISEAKRGKHYPKVAAALRGIKRSEETKKKIGDAHRGKYNTKISKAVQALDKITGEVVYEFPSAAEAQRQGFNSGCISDCCLGKRKSHKGLIWRYKENAQE